MRHELKRRRIRWYRVSSAGLNARAGSPMTEESKQALREAKIAYAEDFKARELTEAMISEAYAVVCLTSKHAEALRAYPNVTSFPEICGKEIPDPYGSGIDVYRTTLRNIRECLPRIIRAVCPPITEES